MATVTEYDGATTQSTTDTTSYNSGNIAPTLGQLLVIPVIAAGTVTNGSVTAAANGVSTFTLVDRATFSTSTHSAYIFVADQLTTGTATMTVTFNCAADAATGAIVHACALNGMQKTGAAAVRQSIKIDNGAGASTPSFVLPSAAQSDNATLYVLGEISTGGVLTPTGWTQGAGGSFSTPTFGGAYGYRNSGFSGTTVTWPGNETAHGGVLVEFDTTGLPKLVMPPRTY